MKQSLLLLMLLCAVTYAQQPQSLNVVAVSEKDRSANLKEKDAIGKVLDQWHIAAANGKFDEYFGHMSNDAIFIGTDATENWNVKELKAFAKPQFDKGKGWDFKPVQRNIYMNADKTVAWFNELLDTWMKVCQGSGVMRFEKGQWKIVHYVLSMTIPNDNANEVIKVITPLQDRLLKELNEKK